MSTTTTNGAPLSFQVRVLHDPENRLYGQLPAQVTDQGLLIQSSHPVVVPTGTPVSYLGHNRMAVKVENREIQLAVKRPFSNQNLLTYDLVAYLNGDINRPEAQAYRLPWSVFLPALLVLGLPLVMWFILDYAEASETQRALDSVKATQSLQEVRKVYLNDAEKALKQLERPEGQDALNHLRNTLIKGDSADLKAVQGALQAAKKQAAQMGAEGAASFQLTQLPAADRKIKEADFALEGLEELKHADKAQEAVDNLAASRSLQGQPFKDTLEALRDVDMAKTAKALETMPSWVASTRMWIFLGSICVALLLAGICLFNAFKEGWKIGRRIASAFLVVVIGYLLAFGSLIILQYDFSQKESVESEDATPQARFKLHKIKAGEFEVEGPGLPKTDRIKWQITPTDAVELDSLTWADAELGMTYTVTYGKLPKDWEQKYFDLKDPVRGVTEARLIAEAQHDQPGSRVLTNPPLPTELNNNKPKGTQDGTPYPAVEIRLELGNKEQMIRRVCTVTRDDGTWVYWTSVSGKTTDPSKWPVQKFHLSFRITDLPYRIPPLAPPSLPGGGGGGQRRRPRQQQQRQPGGMNMGMPGRGGQGPGGGPGGPGGGGRRGGRGFFGPGGGGPGGPSGRSLGTGPNGTAPSGTAPQPTGTAPKPGNDTAPKPGETAPKPGTGQPDGFGVLFLQDKEKEKETEERRVHPSQRLKPFVSEAGRFTVYVPGKGESQKILWPITSDDGVELEKLTWSDEEIGMTYVVAFGKLPSKLAKTYLKDQERLKAEALRDFPGAKVVKYSDQVELQNNKPKGTPDNTPYYVHEFRLEQENKEQVIRRVFTVERDDGTWLYWTTASGKAADPKRWTVQYFHLSFRLTDLPYKVPPLAAPTLPGGDGKKKGGKQPV
jgi:uncharacterized membrane protein YgcG